MQSTSWYNTSQKIQDYAKKFGFKFKVGSDWNFDFIILFKSADLERFGNHKTTELSEAAAAAQYLHDTLESV